MREKWSEIRKLHAAAVARYAASAAAVATERWAVHPAEGKWSPAEITEHLLLAFEVFGSELEGGPPMKARTKGVFRQLLRLTVLRRMLSGGAFPKGAPAPREVRPAQVTESQATAIARFQRRAEELDRTMNELVAAGSSVRLQHPYFGPLSIPEIVRISVSHIEHHRAQLPPAHAIGSTR